MEEETTQAYSAKAMRTRARQLLAGHWKTAVTLSLSYGVLLVLTAVLRDKTMAVGTIATLIVGLVGVSLVYGFYSLVQADNDPETETTLTWPGSLWLIGENNRLKVNVIAYVLVSLFTFLWTLLLIVPGIIKALSYSQTYYILADAQANDVEMSAMEAIKTSQMIMKGHKWEFFCLQLSFLGWMILAGLTFGIGWLWLGPYLSTTKACYYDYVASEADL